jgi:hypothetical protein
MALSNSSGRISCTANLMQLMAFTAFPIDGKRTVDNLGDYFEGF